MEICLNALPNINDGTPDAVKVACPVLAGGKAGDSIKGLPIGTGRGLIFTSSLLLCLAGGKAGKKKLCYCIEADGRSGSDRKREAIAA